MIVLPKYYRFRVLNNTGQNISAGNVKIYARRFKFDSAGALSYESSETTLYTSSGTITNGSYDASSVIDNTSSLYIGGSFVIEITAPASSAGNVICFFERSTDGTTRIDTAGVGDVVAVLNFTTSGTKFKSFSI